MENHRFPSPAPPNQSHPPTSNMSMHRYEIWWADLSPAPGSHLQTGRRPVIIVSNDIANTHSPVITVVPLTAQRKRLGMPTHVLIQGQGLDRWSIALCEQVTSVDKTQLTKRIGYVFQPFDQLALRHALAVQLGMAS